MRLERRAGDRRGRSRACTCDGTTSRRRPKLSGTVEARDCATSASTCCRGCRPTARKRCSTTGRYVRSVPRDERPARAHAYWRCDDVDGDGLALTMRVRDPAARWPSRTEFPGLAAAAHDRRSAAVLQGLSGRRHREFRRQQRADAALPVRQPDRPQPQLPVLLGARLQAGGRGRVSAERGRVARRRRVRDRSIRRSFSGSTCTRSAACSSVRWATSRTAR